MDEKILMRFQSENMVFKFLRSSMDAALSSDISEISVKL